MLTQGKQETRSRSVTRSIGQMCGEKLEMASAFL